MRAIYSAVVVCVIVRNVAWICLSSLGTTQHCRSGDEGDLLGSCCMRHSGSVAWICLRSLGTKQFSVVAQEFLNVHKKVRSAAGVEILVWDSTNVNTLGGFAKSAAEQQCVSLVACSTNSLGQNSWCVSNLQGAKGATSCWVQGFASSGMQTVVHSKPGVATCFL